MYFAEQMIDGVLCWKSSPDDDWTPYTSAELSKRVIELEKALYGQSASA